MNLASAARARLKQAEGSLGTEVASRIAKELDRLERLEDLLKEQTHRVQHDERLSPEGKQADVAKIVEEYDSTTAGIVENIGRIVSEAEQAHRRKLTLPPLQGDDVQGRLLNSRHDARMVLDAASDDRLPQAMETLARDPGDLGYLMLGESFAERYLMGRGNNAAAARWHSIRDDLLVERLGPEAAEARRALAGIQDARAVHLILEHHTRNASNAAREPTATPIFVQTDR